MKFENSKYYLTHGRAHHLWRVITLHKHLFITLISTKKNVTFFRRLVSNRRWNIPRSQIFKILRAWRFSEEVFEWAARCCCYLFVLLGILNLNFEFWREWMSDGSASEIKFFYYWDFVVTKLWSENFVMWCKIWTIVQHSKLIVSFKINLSANYVVFRKIVFRFKFRNFNFEPWIWKQCFVFSFKFQFSKWNKY